MMDVLNYRQYAADCMRQAHDEDTPDGRNILLNVAVAWLRLAEQTEALSVEAMTVDVVPTKPSSWRGAAAP